MPNRFVCTKANCEWRTIAIANWGGGYVSLSGAANFVLGVFILMMAAIWSYSTFAPEYQPPVKYLSIAILTRAITPGQKILGRLTTDVRRNCPGKSQRFIIKLVDGAEMAVFRDEVDVLPKKIGEA